MSAKRTKSSDPNTKDQNPLADQSEDSITTETASEVLDAVADSEPLSETANEPQDETSAQDDAVTEDTSNTPEPETADELQGQDDTVTDDTSEPEAEDAADTDNETEAVEDGVDPSVEEPGEAGDGETQDATDPAEDPVDEIAVDEEAVVETESEPEPQERVVERVVETRSVFVPAIFGGLVAGIVGFAAASTDQVSGLLSGDDQTVAAAEVSAEEVAALRDQIAALEARLAETPDAPDAPDLSGVEAQIADGLAQQADAFAAADAALGARLDDLAAQLTELAQAPVEASISEDAIAAYEAELAAVQAALAEQRAEVETMIAEAAEMEADATESARLAQAQAAATRLFAALDTGSAFSTEVTELQSLGVTVPDALVASAGGLTSLGALQADFPTLARTALAAARDETAGSSGFSGFLQRQLGARSVTPRDGDDPDAILSRAEAALTQGDLSAALTELDMLPDAAKAPLSDWSTAAAARQAALSAADDLAQTLASN